jgi:hypothetical protein
MHFPSSREAWALDDFKITIDELEDQEFRVGEIEKVVHHQADVSSPDVQCCGS